MFNSSTSELSIESRRVDLIDEDFSICGIDARSVFLPEVDVNALDELLDTLWRRRQRVLLAIDIHVRARQAALADSSGFTSALATFRRSSERFRRALLESPPIRIWLQRMRTLNLMANNDAEVDGKLINHLLREYCRIQEQAHCSELTSNAGNFCSIQRYDVDPLVSEAAPPSFVFNYLYEKRLADQCRPYTTKFFSEVLRAAMLRIESIWPEMATVIPWFVKTIIHLPDLSSRSCSAQRFAGAIMLSTSDDSLLKVEESLIHECGHQILYCVMELDPLIKTDAKGSFILPWSGSERDAYGYFHATYIYLILALFLERMVSLGPDKNAADQRLGEILQGLKPALIDFEHADFFTPLGKKFFQMMWAIGMKVIGRNGRYLLH